MNPFSVLAAYVYQHPDKYAKYGRLLPKEEAKARLKHEAAEWFESGEELVMNDGSTFHEFLLRLLDEDLIVIFERNGKLYPCRTLLLIDPELDKTILDSLEVGE